LVVPRIPNPESVVAFAPEFADIEAVGIPEFILRIENLALADACPPIAKSTVEFAG
jgi:hypothetical protein